MNHRRNDVLGPLRRLIGLHDRSTAGSTGRPHPQGTYRSSRDTAAERLRGEDARLLGLTAVRPGPSSSLIDYYNRG